MKDLEKRYSDFEKWLDKTVPKRVQEREEI